MVWFPSSWHKSTCLPFLGFLFSKFPYSFRWQDWSLPPTMSRSRASHCTSIELSYSPMLELSKCSYWLLSKSLSLELSSRLSSSLYTLLLVVDSPPVCGLTGCNICCWPHQPSCSSDHPVVGQGGILPPPLTSPLPAAPSLGKNLSLLPFWCLCRSDLHAPLPL